MRLAVAAGFLLCNFFTLPCYIEVVLEVSELSWLIIVGVLDSDLRNEVRRVRVES